MFGLYMLAIYLGIAIIVAGVVALLVVIMLAVGLVTHPIRTLALIFHKLAALAAGLALILGIDRFMSEARALTNLVGNGVATVVVAKWCNQLDEKQLKDTLNNKNAGADKTLPSA